MRADQFKAWRKALQLKQQEAANLLGLKKRMIQYYERGERDGHPVVIPKPVRLACYAISLGILDFDGLAPRLLETPLAEPKAEVARVEPVGDGDPSHRRFT